MIHGNAGTSGAPHHCSNVHYFTGHRIKHFDVLAEHLAHGSPPPLQASLRQTPVQLNLLIVVPEIIGLIHPLD
jgi:hypothetical protein